MPLRVTRRNVQGGRYTSTGFHPFRSSVDYDPELAGDDYGAGTGFKRYTRTRKTEAAKKRRRKVAAKGKRKTTAKRRNPTAKKGDWASYHYRDSHGTLRAITGKVMAVVGTMVSIRSDGGQPGYPRGKLFHLNLSDTGLSITHKNPRKRSASLLRPARGKESPRVRKALTKYVRGKNPGKLVKVLGYEVREGSKRHQQLLAQKKQFDDMQRSETGRGRKNPGKRKRTERAKQATTWRQMGIRRLKGVHSGARRMEQIRQSRDRGSRSKSPYAKSLQVNPQPGGSKLYEVKIPRTASDTGYTLTIRAKTKRTARAEAKSYCADAYSKKTGNTKASYRLPSTTKVTEVR